MAVHGLFLLGLVLSMSWKNMPHLPVEAELWTSLAPQPTPALQEPLPLPAEPLLSTSPPLPPPALEPAPAPAPAPADIALEEKEKQRAEEEQRRQEALRKEEARKEEERQEEQRRLEVQRQEEEKVRRLQEEQAERERIEQLRQGLARRQQEQEQARQAQAAQAQAEAQMRAQQELLQRRNVVVEDFRQRIQVKVQSYVRLPQNISGNPEAVFKVNLFANGEVRSTELVKSSGNPAYDLEVERAILKASPLPLPNEKDAAALFRSGLILKFRPQ